MPIPASVAICAPSVPEVMATGFFRFLALCACLAFKFLALHSGRTACKAHSGTTAIRYARNLGLLVGRHVEPVEYRHRLLTIWRARMHAHVSVAAVRRAQALVSRRGDFWRLLLWLTRAQPSYESGRLAFDRHVVTEGSRFMAGAGTTWNGTQTLACSSTCRRAAACG